MKEWFLKKMTFIFCLFIGGWGLRDRVKYIVMHYDISLEIHNTKNVDIY